MSAHRKGSLPARPQTCGSTDASGSTLEGGPAPRLHVKTRAHTTGRRRRGRWGRGPGAARRRRGPRAPDTDPLAVCRLNRGLAETGRGPPWSGAEMPASPEPRLGPRSRVTDLGAVPHSTTIHAAVPRSASSGRARAGWPQRRRPGARPSGLSVESPCAERPSVRAWTGRRPPPGSCPSRLQ